MWESPIYKFKTEIDGKKKNIFVDVTGSAPNFKDPGKQLKGSFKSLLDGLEPSKTKILDFGGAKLRNTIYLLEKGYTVYSCEFKDLFNRSKQAQDFLQKAKGYRNFKTLVFPDDFINFEEKFDVVLLINVLNIMPIQMERLLVLALCREKMKENGRLFWYTQHGGYSKEAAVAELLDGLVTGKGREYHMFYRDFTKKEIHTMLQSTGFSFNRKFAFPTSGPNQAYVFNPDGPILVNKTLALTSQLKKNVQKRLEPLKRDAPSIKSTYETKVPTRIAVSKDISILETYSKELDKINPGRRQALKYHKLIFSILKLVFDEKLKKGKMEEKIADGIKRVDITFKNPRSDGFFKDLDNGYHIICPNIFIECKNYNDNLGDREFGQIQGRLNNVRGQFGILICRKVENVENIKKRQDDAIKKKDYVIVLEDEDIKKMVDWKLNGDDEEIEDHLEEKFKRLT